MGVSGIKKNITLDVNSLNTIYTNKYDAENQSNVLKVDSAKQYYEDANLEIYQVDVDNDGELDDVYRIDKLDEDGNRTAMGYVNADEVSFEKKEQQLNAIAEEERRKGERRNREYDITHTGNTTADLEAQKGLDKLYGRNTTNNAGTDVETASLGDGTVLENPTPTAETPEKSIGSTIAYAGTKFTEGAVSVGEGFRDFLETANAHLISTVDVGLQTTWMALKDTFGKGATEADYKELDRRLRVRDEFLDETKAEVAENMVAEYMYNPIYENTKMEEKAYAADKVGKVAYTSGKVAEVIGLSFIPGYLAGAGVAGGGTAVASEAGTALATTGAETTAVSTTVLAGSSGASAASTTLTNIITNPTNIARVTRMALGGIAAGGEQAQKAFQNGAGFEEGLGSMYAKGLWTAAQWGIGEKIFSLTPFAAEGATPLINQLANSGIHVAGNTLNAASDGFVQPLIDKIWNGKSYLESFQANGGWNTVATQALTGLILSGLSEIPSIRDAVRAQREAPIIENTQPSSESAEAQPNDSAFALEDKQAAGEAQNTQSTQNQNTTNSQEAQSAKTDNTSSGSQNTQGKTDNTSNSSQNTQGKTDSTSSGSQNTQGKTDSTSSGSQNAQGKTDSTSSGSQNAQGKTDSTSSGSQNSGKMDIGAEMAKLREKLDKGEITKKEYYEAVKKIHPDNNIGGQAA